jgi:2-polyprenyl-6-methoxyphenol hydroxylase-like FAD-dependent oxidoreductase
MKIAIVGAGPAGLACACQLAKQGRQVSIFERMTDLSAQGSGVLIQPVGLLALDLLELRDSAERVGRKIRQIKGSSLPSGRATVSVDYRLLSGIDYALGIDRSAFWDLLYAKALSLGLEVHSGISIDKLHHYPDGRVSVSDTSEQSYGPFDLVVDASGSNSVLDSYAIEAANSKLLEYGSLWTKVNVSSEFRFNHNAMTLFF